MSEGQDKNKRELTGGLGGPEGAEGKGPPESSDRLFRLVFENVASGVMITGPDGRVIMANPPALTWLGLGDDAQGQDLMLLAPSASGLLSRAHLGVRHRTEIEAADGQRRLIGFTNEVVDLGGSKGLITMFQDIGQIHRAEDRKRRAEQLAYVGELASKLSHEIKNPLATIQAGLKVLARGAGLDHESTEVLGTVLKEVENTVQLVKSLLNAARYEKFKPEVVNLVPVLHEIFDVFINVAKGAGVKLDLETPLNDATAILDKKAFGRALGNLVHNAIDAACSGGNVRMICERLTPDEIQMRFPGFKGPVARIKVSDNGPGVPAENRRQIFEPFFTTKESGTGLGLAVAREIVDSHGGVLGLSENPEGGAVFEIYLPIGRRPPCWEWVVYHDWEIYYGEDRCESCEVKRNATGHLCWTIKMSEFSEEGPRYPERCMNCPVFLAGNLGHYQRTGG